MNISILASIGAQNLGDELILKNEIAYFQSKYGMDTKFQVFSYEHKNPLIISKHIKYYEYFPSNIKKISRIFTNIKNFFIFIKVIFQSNLVVIGGGGIFFDNETDNASNPLTQWVLRTKIISLLRKKMHFHAVGIYVQNSKNLIRIQKIFGGKNKKITVRDKSSYQTLKELGIESKIIADPVFSDNGNNKQALKTNYCLDKINPKQFHIEDICSYNLDNKVVGISFRLGYFWNDIKAIKEVTKYIIKNNGQVIFLPTSFHKTNTQSNDYKYMKKFADKYNCEISKSMGETYHYFTKQKPDMILAMRLHSIILSQVYKIPYIALSYSKKTDEVLKVIYHFGKKNNKK